MAKLGATLLAVATFVVGVGLCIALFAVLDVDAVYIIGPGVVVAAGALVVYRSALRDDPGQPQI